MLHGISWFGTGWVYLEMENWVIGVSKGGQSAVQSAVTVTQRGNLELLCAQRLQSAVAVTPGVWSNLRLVLLVAV